MGSKMTEIVYNQPKKKKKKAFPMQSDKIAGITHAADLVDQLDQLDQLGLEHLIYEERLGNLVCSAWGKEDWGRI